MEVRRGEGGEDSRLFVDDLAAAYLKYAESKGLRCDLLERSEGCVAIQVAGQGVWGAFRHEPGKHVIQRIPPTEKKGRRQTSVVSVAMLPLFEWRSRPVPDEEIEFQTTGGHGSGGQHQNTTESAVRAIHKPTGLRVFINGRKQLQNKKLARRILAAKVNELYLSRQKDDRNRRRAAQWAGGGRAGKVRTYNFLDGRVTDHRLGRQTRQIGQLMKGRFDLLLGE